MPQGYVNQHHNTSSSQYMRHDLCAEASAPMVTTSQGHYPAHAPQIYEDLYARPEGVVSVCIRLRCDWLFQERLIRREPYLPGPLETDIFLKMLNDQDRFNQATQQCMSALLEARVILLRHATIIDRQPGYGEIRSHRHQQCALQLHYATEVRVCPPTKFMALTTGQFPGQPLSLSVVLISESCPPTSS